ncbi:MAG: glycoside hydrolase family 15 protein [Alphaproteobacteria bacterium]|nr:glycoside hydrolase family 15 protein [Alphaproteobacteria bacterium]
MRIEDYAVIGDCHTAALVGRDGSIDWLCMPRFDSAACFAALLGEPKHGRWLIAPDRKVRPYRKRGTPHVARRYRGDSLILETEFRTATGVAKVIDFMPVHDRDRSIVRIVEGVSGHVKMETELVIRFDYGVTIPWVNRIDSKTISAVAGPNLLCVRTPVDIRGENMHSAARFTVRKGERVPFILSYRESHYLLPEVIDADIALEQTEKYWADWTGICKLKGKWRSEIVRSLLTLKSLSYKPTGGIVAAVTTSLPEQIGGNRNWDYRYCWLRDATFTLLAFLNAGYTEEANVWQHWLVRVIAGAPEQLQTMYDVMGGKRLDELELPHLPGYENSRPVRIGNAAAQQLQLDIYGELADVLTQARKGGLPPAPRRSEIRETFLRHLETIWKKPDEGIWEIRGAPQQFVHSKVMTWVAFDRASLAYPQDKRRSAHYRKIANQIHEDICAKGVDRKRGCFVQAYGSERMDASLLLLPLVGFLPASDKRIRRTVEEIEKRLLRKGLLLRYETETGIDGLPPGEGAFLACSFWLADNYLLLGRQADARRLFHRLKGYANDVGLFAEEYDPEDKRMLGNFPQAFSHVALINTALNLAQEENRRNDRKPARKKITRRQDPRRRHRRHGA